MCQLKSSCMRVDMVFELIIVLWLSCQAFLYLSLLPTMPPGPSQQASFDWTIISGWRLLSYIISMVVETFRTFAHFSDPATVGLGFGRRATLMRHFIKYPLAAPQWMRRSKPQRDSYARNQSQVLRNHYHPSWLRENPSSSSAESFAWFFFKIRILTIRRFWEPCQVHICLNSPIAARFSDSPLAPDPCGFVDLPSRRQVRWLQPTHGGQLASDRWDGVGVTRKGGKNFLISSPGR